MQFLALAAKPASAQGGVSDGHAFVKAVRDRDGSKVGEMLRSRPAVVNARDDKGETGLMVAISQRDVDFTTYLLSQGADPTLVARNGDTALIMAARIGYADAAKYLLDLRAPVDAANRMGETALIVAVQQRQAQVVKLLLAAGANPDKTDNAAGLSARDYAKRDTRSREILALIEGSTKKPPAKTFTPPKDAGDFTIK
jgi:ankyrin repeat protein